MACRAPGSDDDGNGGLSRDLAATPIPAEDNDALSDAAPRTRPQSTNSGGATGGDGRSPSADATTSPAAGPFTELGTISDARGDHAIDAAPDYGDLRRVEIATDGSNARVTVEVGAAIPKRLPAGEVVGIGVDLYRKRIDLESTYQLFVDGGPEGWFAYLYVRDRFVRYPGSFTLAGRRLVFIVPWASVGDLQRGRFSAFADWSRRGEAKNDIGEDRAPDRLTAAYGPG